MKTLKINQALSSLTKPEHPVLLVSGGEDEVNVMVAGWVMRTSFSPPLIAVSVGHSRHTHSLMLKYNEFVLSYPSPGQESLIELAGTTSGKDLNKFSKIDQPLQGASAVKLPVFTASRVNFECRKKAKKETGDHTVFIGEVIAASGNPSKQPLVNTGNYNYRKFNL